MNDPQSALFTRQSVTKCSVVSYTPHPFRFLVPSQLVSSLSEPPPPVPTDPLPPAARKSLSISSLETFISSLNCLVRVLARSLMNSVVPVHDTLPNRLWVASIRCLLSVASRLCLNASAMMPMPTISPCSCGKS